MWHDLAPRRAVGLSAAATSGSRSRSAERECQAWFLEECAAPRPRVQSDGNGNTIAWWLRPTGIVPTFGPLSRADGIGTRRRGLSVRTGVLTGSHLDSVLDGGAYDGPLGVVSALAAVDLLRERGVPPDPADRGRRCSSRRRARASGWPASARGW